MIRANWNGELIAESSRTVVVEGNHYFPHEDVRAEMLQRSETQTVCGWKGTAEYYDVLVGGQINRDAAWVYQDPLEAASQIAGRIAFWKGIAISDEP